jgi:hypothetical protein
MKTCKTISMIMAIILVSCTKYSYKEFEGSWIPYQTKYSSQLVRSMQILKRDNFFIVAVDYLHVNDYQFFIAIPEKDHLVVTSSLSSNDYLNKFLDHPANMYYDKKLNRIFFLNTVYSPSDDKILELVVNVGGDREKQQLRVKPLE